MHDPMTWSRAMRARWIPLFLTALALTAANRAEAQAYEACGTVVQIASCPRGPVFQPDAPQQEVIIVENLGGFPVGSRVHVVGTLLPCDPVFCLVSDYCLATITVEPCAPCACTSYCAGDGSSVPCPCSAGGSNAGCPNSLNAVGANLFVSGGASLAQDTIVLNAQGMTGSWTLYLQGSGATDVVFGDGKRCVGGTLVRLGTSPIVYSSSKLPHLGDPRVSVLGHIASPGTRTYQGYYRDAAPHCTGAMFNLTNAVSIVWAP